MKKFKLLLAVTALIGTIVIMQSLAPPPPGSYDISPQALSIRQSPPQIHHIWIRKLITPQGPNTMQLSLDLDTSYVFEPVTDTIAIFWGDLGSQKIIFYDNGSQGDPVAGDGIYCAYINQSVAAFRAEMVARDAALTTNGGYIKFTGHDGTESGQGFAHFDFSAFDIGTPVEIHDGYATLRFCGSIKREKSLFITDLSVVENPAVTYNFMDNTGNPNGKWTFGHLFKNIAGSSVPVKDLLKSFIKPWTQNTVVNGQTALMREDVFILLIKPWLVKAGAVLPTTGPSAGEVDATNWESIWDQAGVTGSNLCKYAPFRLTAIVNRLDVRENIAYNAGVVNSGETRFIFTLINYATGLPPEGLDQDSPSGDKNTLPYAGEPYIDWQGMNVIFEYGNVETTKCGLKSLAESWVNLSSLDLGSDPYMEALQDITDRVTETNAAPGRPNGSAINRIRTNEKIFFFRDFRIDITTGGAEIARWSHADWEFRQFELNNLSHTLIQAPVTNTPNNFFNTANNLSSSSYFVCRGGLYGGNIQDRYKDLCSPVAMPEVANLVNWVFNPAITKQILRGNHNMPKTYDGHYMTGATGQVVGEFSHYFSPNTEYNIPLLSRPDFDNVRHQLSLNTCEGCHNGENKTIFTHIRPTPYGTSSRYWSTPVTIPDVTQGFLDCPGNGLAGSPVNQFTNLYPDMAGRRIYQNVSAFLTGYSYAGTVAAPSYGDDHPSDANDNNMDGLFYVNDPSKESAAPNKFGYNDLLRRQDDLCNLVNSSCTDFSVFSMITNVKFVPLPLGGH